MKRLFSSLIYIPLFLIVLVVSCKKDFSETNNNYSAEPIAKAGDDIVLTLPINNSVLDGSASRDPNGYIISYSWKKISGPESFLIENSSAVITAVKNLSEGTYLFELTVTNREGLSAKDTVQIKVNASGNAPRKVVVALNEVGTLKYGGQTTAVLTPGKIVFVELLTDPPILNIFDITTRQVKSVTAPMQGNFISVVASGDKVFLAGGTVYDEISDVVHYYDISEDKWYNTKLPEPRTAMGAGAIANKVLFAGGINDDFWGESSVVDIYDLTTNEWSESSLSTPKMGVTVVTAGDKVYFGGGSDYLMGGGPFNSVDVYMSNNGSFYQRSFNTLWGQVAGLSVGDKIYWAGEDVTASNGKAEVWNTISTEINVYPLSYARKAPAVVSMNQYILFGTPSDYWWTSEETRQYSNQVDILDTSTGDWLIGTLPNPIYNAAYISVGNTIYMAGGNLGSKANNNKIYTLSW